MSLTDRQRKAIDDWTRDLNVDTAHMVQVTRLALQLFDRLQDLHGEPASSRDLLEAAGLTHDVGFAKSQAGHHKHSRDMILRQGLPGFSTDEVRAVASIARYHRKAFPSASHNLLASLDPAMQRTVERLSAILRLADGLDRTHRSAIRDLECRLEKGILTIRVRARGDAGPDILGGERKKDYFETLFGCSVEFSFASSRSRAGAKENAETDS